MQRIALTAVVVLLTLGAAHRASALEMVEDPSQIQRLSHVETPGGLPPAEESTGVWRYEYIVFNDSAEYLVGGGDDQIGRQVSPAIVGYLLPLPLGALDNGLVWDIQAPDPVSTYQWVWDIVTQGDYQSSFGQPSPFGTNPHEILIWYDSNIFGRLPINTRERAEGDEVRVWFMPDLDKHLVPMSADDQDDSPYFTFLSTLPPTDGPYAAWWMDDFWQIGDPPIPGSVTGSVPFDPRTQQDDRVPEPTTLSLLALGLLAFARRRRAA